jgi:phosphate transport system substrate-binding protein
MSAANPVCMFVVGAALVLTACSPSSPAAPVTPQAVRIDGSSTVYPMTQAVAAAIAAQPDAPSVEVAESGTSSGFTRLCAGEIDIAGASRPIQTREMIACHRAGIRYVEIPVGFDGVTFIVHRSNAVSTITLEQAEIIWAPPAQATVMNWRQVNASWGDRPLALFGPGAQSGTFDYLTEVVMGQVGASRTDYAASEDDTVIVDGVAGDPNALGYVGYAYFDRNRDRLKALAVDSGAGAVLPSAETIASGQYAPLSRPIFIYVNAAALDRPEVARFAAFYVANGARLAAEVGYVALPDAAYAAYGERLQNRQVGSAFGGRSAVGQTIESVIALPLVEPGS